MRTLHLRVQVNFCSSKAWFSLAWALTVSCQSTTPHAQSRALIHSHCDQQDLILCNSYDSEASPWSENFFMSCSYLLIQDCSPGLTSLAKAATTLRSINLFLHNLCHSKRETRGMNFLISAYGMNPEQHCSSQVALSYMYKCANLTSQAIRSL